MNETAAYFLGGSIICLVALTGAQGWIATAYALMASYLVVGFLIMRNGR